MNIIKCLKSICLYNLFKFITFIRSLQLSERSPNRTPLTQQQQNKLVVRLTGNLQPVQNEPFRPSRSSSLQQQSSSNHRYPQTPQNSHESINLNQPKDFRIYDQDKSKSFDADYGHSQQYQSYNFKTEFDKSRSFDDDYGNTHRLNVKSVADARSLSNDRVNQKGIVKSSSSSSSQKQQSPQSYGSRLYEHEMMYDLARKAMDRSPIMEFRRQKRGSNNRSRERSPNTNVPVDAKQINYRPLNRSVERSLNNRRDVSPGRTTGGSAFAQHHTGSSSSNYLSAPNSHSSPGSDYDHQDSKDRMNRRESDLVNDFLYGHKNTRATEPSAGLHPPRRKESNAKNASTASSSATGESPSPGRYIRN